MPAEKMPDPVREWSDKGPYRAVGDVIWHRDKTKIAVFYGNPGLAERAAGWMNRDVAEIEAWVAERRDSEFFQSLNRSRGDGE